MSKLIPSPKSLPMVGTLFSILKEGGASQLHKYVDKRHKELGPIYKEKIGPCEGYFLNNADDMKKVFASEGMYPVHILPESWVKYNDLYGCARGIYFMDGEEWMKHRKIVNKYLLKMFSAESQYNLTKDLLSQFEHNIVSDVKSSAFHLEDHVTHLSIQFIVAHMLGTPFISHQKLFSTEVSALSKEVNKIFEYSAALSLLPINLSVKLKLPAWTNFVQSVNQSLELGSALCHKMEEIDGDGLMSNLREEGVPQDMIRRIVIDLILAANDTIGVSTQWIFYLLGRHPDIQDHLWEELHQQDPSKCLESDTLKHIIRESLRLYPVAPFLTRVVAQDVEIGDYLIPKNSLVLLSIYSSSHNPAYFPSPEKFQPQRWRRDATGKYKAVVDSYASLPYAMGARSCIGRKLAHTQMCMITAQIVRNHRIHVKSPVDMILKLIPMPSKPIEFELTPR